MYWPSAPMLKRPVWKANATPTPVSRIGVALMMTLAMYLGLPSAPEKSAPKEPSGS